MAVKEYIYVDTETTGLFCEVDEILSVSVIDDNGKCLFNSLVKPSYHSYWYEAEAIHGISPDMVKNAPTFDEIKNKLKAIFRDKNIIAYNAPFDAGFLQDTLDECKSIECAMRAFAHAIKSPKWLKLIEAVHYCDPNFRFKAHNSLEDCQATRIVWNYLLNNQASGT